VGAENFGEVVQEGPRRPSSSNVAERRSTQQQRQALEKCSGENNVDVVKQPAAALRRECITAMQLSVPRFVQKVGLHKVVHGVIALVLEETINRKGRAVCQECRRGGIAARRLLIVWQCEQSLEPSQLLPSQTIATCIRHAPVPHTCRQQSAAGSPSSCCPCSVRTSSSSSPVGCWCTTCSAFVPVGMELADLHTPHQLAPKGRGWHVQQLVCGRTAQLQYHRGRPTAAQQQIGTERPKQLTSTTPRCQVRCFFLLPSGARPATVSMGTHTWLPAWNTAESLRRASATSAACCACSCVMLPAATLRAP